MKLPRNSAASDASKQVQAEKAAVHTGNGKKWYNPNQSPVVVVSVPDWTSKDLKTGTLRSIVKDLGFDWDEFAKA